VKPAQCKLFLDGETGKRPNGHRRTLADGFICLRVDTVCLCVGCVTKSWEILTAEMYWWLLLY
jgi:hypothetical protein